MLVERIEDQCEQITAGADLDSAGLMRGLSGAASFVVPFAALTGDVEPLGAARTALRLDLGLCVGDRRGGLYLNDGTRLLPYLGFGSVGIGMVLEQYQRLAGDDEVSDDLAGTVLATGNQFYLFPGLFEGAAGIVLFLAGTRAIGGAERQRRLVEQVQIMNWHVVHVNGRRQIPGSQLMRISTDLATGSAGVVLALAAASDAAASPSGSTRVGLPFSMSPPLLPLYPQGGAQASPLSMERR